MLPDCIISDLRVSDADAEDIVDLLAMLEATVPFVILSADPALLRSHALAGRVVATLTKPVNPDELTQAIRDAPAFE